MYSEGIIRSVSTLDRASGMNAPWIVREATARSGRCGPAPELRGDLGDVAALVARALELVGARLARAVSAGDGAGAIRRAAADLPHLCVARPGIRQADDDHAMVQQGRVDGGDGHLLAAMLARRRGEGAAD